MAKGKKMQHRKIRAIELFHPASPFKPKTVKSKKAYNRKPRSSKKDFS